MDEHEREKWEAVTGNDMRCDGSFFYAVKTTGIFCRPSCKSKVPSPENVVYFDRMEDAFAAGYRPCKRCRPDETQGDPAYDLTEQAKAAVERYACDRELMAEALASMGASRKNVDRLFRQRFGVSPRAYADRLRQNKAQDWLLNSEKPILDIAEDLGFASLSAFFAFFAERAGMTPNEYRKTHGQPVLQQDALFVSVYESPIGWLVVGCSDSAVLSVRFGAQVSERIVERPNHWTGETVRQLHEYFVGEREAFSLPLAPAGTPFQQTVWRALQDIPYGQTRSYGEVARAIGQPSASRAVGNANNRNPLPILIPCHRVVGANGALVGYAGGVQLKQRLLELEQTSKNRT